MNQNDFLKSGSVGTDGTPGVDGVSGQKGQKGRSGSSGIKGQKGIKGDSSSGGGGGSSYIRWGRHDCSSESSLVYQGEHLIIEINFPLPRAKLKLSSTLWKYVSVGTSKVLKKYH